MVERPPADATVLDCLVADRGCYDTSSGTYAIPIEAFDAMAAVIAALRAESVECGWCGLCLQDKLKNSDTFDHKPDCAFGALDALKVADPS